MTDFPYDDNYVDLFYFISGLLWVPYCCILFYCYQEHRQRKKFPQDVILLLLFLGAVLRCVWFLAYYKYGTFMVLIVINRAAILMQFSSVSVLMTMWMRALIITRIADRMTGNTTAPPANVQSTPGSNIRASTMSSDRVRELARRHEQALIANETERQQQVFVRSMAIINIVLWTVTLSTLAEHTDIWYAINLISIALICLFQAIVTLLIGFRVAFLLQKELKPVFANNHHNAPTDVQTSSEKDVSQIRFDSSAETRLSWLRDSTKRNCCFCSCNDLVNLYKVLYSSDRSNRSLQLQRGVLRTVISVTMVIFAFFLVRGIVFSFYPIMNIVGILNNCYPWLFYQVPEFFPNMAIAMGVAPPNGLLRKCYTNVRYHYYFFKFYLFVMVLGAKDYCPDELDRPVQTGDEYATQKMTRSVAQASPYPSHGSPRAMPNSVQHVHPPTTVRKSSASTTHGDADGDDDDIAGEGDEDLSQYYDEHPPEPRTATPKADPVRSTSGVLGTVLPFLRFFLASPVEEPATPPASDAAGSSAPTSRYASKDEWLSSRQEEVEYEELLYSIHSFAANTRSHSQSQRSQASEAEGSRVSQDSESPMHDRASQSAQRSSAARESGSSGWSSWKTGPRKSLATSWGSSVTDTSRTSRSQVSEAGGLELLESGMAADAAGK